MSKYDNLLRKKEQETPLENEKREQHWEAMANLLGSSEKFIVKQKRKSKILKMFKPFLIIVLVLVVIFWSYKQFEKKEENTYTNENIVSKVIPPLKSFDIPYEFFTIDINQGDTIFTKNGSIIIFPKNSVTDSDGNIMRGNIQVRTREFNDPIEYSFAGLPMTYDSAGKKYVFVSSGMIDISASQNGEKLFVNPDAKPEIHLASTNRELNTNLYRLDTIKGQWINKGKDEVNILETQPKRANAKPSTTIAIITQKPDAKVIVNNKDVLFEGTDTIATIKKPQLPPIKASGKNPVIEIQIDPESFEELKVYNNLKFEVIGGDEWDPKDSDTEWQNVKLETIKERQMYRVTFTKGDQKISYVVNPVLEGTDYNQAIQAYNQKIKEYEQLKQQREELKMQRDLTAKQEATRIKDLQEKRNDSIEKGNKRIEEINQSIELRNQEIEKENKRIEELNRLIELRNQEIEKENTRISAQIKRNRMVVDSLIRVNDSTNKANAEARKRKQEEADSLTKVFDYKLGSETLKNNIIRSFQIDGFGYWNCDQPTIPGGILFVGIFKDEKGKSLSFTYMNAAGHGINRILSYYNSMVTVSPGINHIMWSFVNGSLYYLTLDEYEKLNITTYTRQVEIRLRKYNGNAKTVEQLKKEIFYVKSELPAK